MKKPALLSELLDQPAPTTYMEFMENLDERWDHIKYQLSKDSNWVGYEWLHYAPMGSKVVITYPFLIDTNGVIYREDKGEYIPRLHRIANGGYREVVLSIDGKQKSLLVHRAVACTFRYHDRADDLLVLGDLEANHDDGVKDNCKVTNLSWMTRSENIRHSVANGLQKSGIEHPDSVPYKGTIWMIGPYKGLSFIVAGESQLRECGVNGITVRAIISGEPLQGRVLTSLIGCTWSIPTEEEVNTLPLGMPKGFKAYYEQNRKLADPKIKPAIATVMNGEFKDREFYFLGATELTDAGFVQAWVSKTASGKKPSYKGLLWRYGTLDEIETMHRGVPEDIKSKL